MGFEENKLFYFGKIPPRNFIKPLVSIFNELGINEKRIVPELASKFGHEGDYIIKFEPPDNPTKLVIGKLTKGKTIQPQREIDGQLDIVEFENVLATDFKLD